MSWFRQHEDRLTQAVEATLSRTGLHPFVESPRRSHHPGGAHAAGRAAFEAILGDRVALDLPGHRRWIGEETSPYASDALGVRYPDVDPDRLLTEMTRAWPQWRDAGHTDRMGVCLEIVDRWSRATFENAYATMHTTGQPFLLAFAGSGAASLGRGLEALAHVHLAVGRIPDRVRTQRSFGGPPVALDRRFRCMPVGIGVVICCGSYPAFNAYPAILASLAAGNPVVVKPHPQAILPMALAVVSARRVLTEAGFSPDLITLAADTADAPIAQHLVADPRVAIVDFTGSPAFGDWLTTAVAGRQLYTETAGCNAVILDDPEDLDAVADAVGHGLCLFSGQMCTSPQNLYVARRAAGPVIDALLAAVDRWALQPGVCGALFHPRVQATVDAAAAGATVLRASTPCVPPDHPRARTATPLVLAADPDDPALVREHFGPVAYVVQVDDREEALARATAHAHTHGAIASYVYTADPAFREAACTAYAHAGASVGIDLVRQRPIQYAGAFSDFHVTGLNPAGNATLTDPAFVSRRFRIVQSKIEIPATS